MIKEEEIPATTHILCSQDVTDPTAHIGQDVTPVGNVTQVGDPRCLLASLMTSYPGETVEGGALLRNRAQMCDGLGLSKLLV